MIYANLSQLEHYLPILPCQTEASDILKFVSEKKFISGKTILSPNVYINMVEYQTKALEESKFEAHRDYIDIQIVLSGEELFGVTFSEYLKEITPYDEEAECSFLQGDIQSTTILKPDTFIIVFPGEPHMPGIQTDGPSTLRKMVVKVKV